MTRTLARRTPACALVAAVVAAAPVAGQERPPLEEGFFELFVQRLPVRLPLITLVDSTGRVLIPLRPVLDHVGIPVAERGDSLVLEWPPGIWTSVLHPGRATLRIGDETHHFERDQWLTQGAESFVSAQVLGRILSARATVSWEELVIIVSENLQFPATRRLEVEARRARESLESALFDPMRFVDVPYPPRSGGFAAGWGVSISEAGGTTRGTLRGTMGATLLGGGLEWGGTGVFGDVESGVDDGFLRYTRVFTASPWVRRVEVGSVLSDGALARRVNGFTLTNQPFTTPRYFGEAVLTPAVPAGWEYEVYQGEHLVGVSTADRPTDIRTPLNYGNTPVRVRMIGPAGQEMVEELVYVVPSGRVQPGQWRYTVGGGSCRDPGCDDYFFGEVIRGLTPRVTVTLGGDRVSDSAHVAYRPFARLGAALRPNVNLDVQLRASSFFRTSLQILSGQRGSLSAAYSSTGTSTAGFGVGGWTAEASATGPLRVFDGRWISGRLLVRGHEHGTVDSWQSSVSTTVRRTNLALDIESGLQPRRLATARVFHALGRDVPDFLIDASLNAALSVHAGGFEMLEMGASARTQQRALVDARLRFRNGSSPVLSLGVSLRSDMGFFQARGSRGGGTGVFLGADGGIAYSPSVGLLPLPYQSVGQGGVAGEVFYDLDGNGVRDPDEPPVGEGRVLVGGRPVPTDEDGGFRAWQLTPYEGMSVAVDSLSVDPEWAPTRPEVLLRPSPNLFSRVVLSVHRTRELVGTVVSAGTEPRPLGGVSIEILDAAGMVVATERTFSDGVFYVQRIRPGAYRVRVAAASARVLGGAQSPVLEFIVPRGEGPEIELPALVVGDPGRGIG